MPRWIAAALLVTIAVAPLPGRDSPVPPERAAALMKVPDGFQVTLFAGEPEVVKPIAMTIDDRGRLWVVESHSYPHWITDGKPGRDRVIILEDTQGTGHFDKKTVFLDRGTNLSGIALGFGGVWLCATPNLLFVPMKPGEDKPAGPAEVVLVGWDVKTIAHNVFNGLTWGPDGWLYGCHGIQATSHVGKPGTPVSERVAFNCGVWRFHPTRRVFEPFAWGTTNPWGLDFDDVGEAFITNCVIKHLFHAIPGAHFQRMYSQDLNSHVYGLMEGCADHLHWAGGNWTESRGGLGAHSDSGGGHAHVGAMVYLGDNWPDRFRDQIFMCNLHGLRVNCDLLERHGSGYVGRHGHDFLTAGDTWFRGLSLQYGPDGGVYLSDWNDTGECHNNDKTTETAGRVFKITYGQPKKVPVDLANAADEELVALQRHKNDWWVRHARRVLQERAAAGRLSAAVVPALQKMLATETEAPRKLRALWALWAVAGLDPSALIQQTASTDAAVRAWAVRLLAEGKSPSVAAGARLAALAHDEPAPSVRLALASALQRLPATAAWPIAEALAAHAADATDANLPLMVWYGVEPLVMTDPARAARLIATAQIPLVRQYIARRLTEGEKLPPLITVLDQDSVSPRDIVRGMVEALQGRRNVTVPDGWAAVSRKLAGNSDSEVREKTLLLSVRFGDIAAVATLRQTAADSGADVGSRQAALQMLVDTKAANLLPLLKDLLANPGPMRVAALHALGAATDPATPATVLAQYPTFADAEKADAVAALSSRADFALALLDAVEHGAVPRRDLSAYTARQLLGLKDQRVTKRLDQVWGTIRPPAKDRAALLNRYRSLVPPDALVKADRTAGHAIFTKTCASCHSLFGEGGKIGPDLTGSQRANPEYVLTKLIDPNAVVNRDYQMSIVTLTNGRVLSGIIKDETDQTLAVQTATELVRVSKSDIDAREKTGQSIMPDGILATLSDTEIRDLIAFIAGPGPVVARP